MATLNLHPDPLRWPAWSSRPGQLVVPLGYRRNGEPIWPVLGAADDDPDEDDQDDEDAKGKGKEKPDPDDEDDEDDEDDDKDPAGAEKLRDAGKKALDSIKASRAKVRAARDKAVKERDAAIAEVAKLKAGKGGGGKAGEDDQPDAEEIRRQARDDADKAARVRSDARIVRAELKAAAAGKLEDPADAVAFIEAEDFEVDDDGEVDTDELDAAIDDLLERKPHLAKREDGDGKNGRRPKPDRSQGPRGASDLDSRIAAARKAGKGREVIRLENEKLRSGSRKPAATPK